MLVVGGPSWMPKIKREITEIEQSVLAGMIRITLQHMKTAWQTITPLEFTIEGHETEPQLLRILAPNEAVVTGSVEVHMADNSGMMNIGIPSIVIKMLRSKFDHQLAIRKSESPEIEEDQGL